MSPVLSSTARTFGIRRRRVRQSTATLFPVSPYATSPKPRAGDPPGGVHSVEIRDDVAASAAVAGSGGSTSGYTTADCPPPTSPEAVPHGFEGRADHQIRIASSEQGSYIRSMRSPRNQKQDGRPALSPRSLLMNSFRIVLDRACDGLVSWIFERP